MIPVVRPRGPMVTLPRGDDLPVELEQPPKKKVGLPVIIAALAVIAVAAGTAAWWHAHATARLREGGDKCISNMSKIIAAYRDYADQHPGEAPDYISKLAATLSNEPALFICPLSGHKAGNIASVDQWADYTLAEDIQSTTNPIVLVCGPENHAGKFAIAGRLDGSTYRYAGDACKKDLRGLRWKGKSADRVPRL